MSRNVRVDVYVPPSVDEAVADLDQPKSEFFRDAGIEKLRELGFLDDEEAGDELEERTASTSQQAKEGDQ